MRLLAGVDAGASHTETALATLSLHELSRHRGGPANMRRGQAHDAAHVIAQTLQCAIDESGRHEGIGTLVVGAAGTGLEDDRLALDEALTTLAIAERVHVTTDGAVALASAFSDGPGIVLMAGTGSIAHARDGAAGRWRVGGHGWRFGDEGSAFALGRAGIGAAIRGSEGRGPATSLSRAILAAVEAESSEDLRRWMDHADNPAVAALASTVCDDADRDDAVARALVQDSADALVSHVTALLTHFPPNDSVQVALGGGLLTPSSAVRDAVHRILASAAPRARVSDAPVDPVVGALSLAAKKASQDH